MSDLVARLRDWRSLHLTRLGALFDEAAAHIELLEAAYKSSGSALAVIDGGFKNAVAEIERLRLTDEERQVIQWAADAMRPDCRATLRKLLERLSPSADSRLAALEQLAELDEELGLPRSYTGGK